MAGLAVLAACGDTPAAPPAAGTDAPPESGGTAVVGVLSDFQNFNPVINTAAASNDVMNDMLFTPILQLDEQLQPRPYLARSWELADSSVVFHLRDDIRWHDGQPVTAEDVKFTFDLAKDPRAASLLGAAFLGLVGSAEVLDPHTIRFTFTEPHSEALEAFRWPPLPSHLFQGVDAASLARSPLNLSPVGSGPFRFVSWERGQSLTLEANTDFPTELGGRPYLDRIVFRVIPEQTTLVTELLTGSIDHTEYLPPSLEAQVRAQAGTQLITAPAPTFTYIGWNTRRPLFSDSRVRRALVMAIDRQGLVDAFQNGHGAVVDGIIPAWHPMYTGLPALPFDPEGARRLLADAGWRDGDNDGVLEKGGVPFEFTLLVNSASTTAQDVATAVHQQLEQVGVRMQIQTLEFQTLIRQHRSRDYDAALASWSLDTFRVDPSALFSCREAQKPESVNRAGYCNPRADFLMSEAMRTLDAERAKTVWAEFSRVLQEDQPITFLYWVDRLVGLSPRLRNVDVDVRGTMVNAREWWIPASERRAVN